jgi:U-box domain
VRQDRANIEAWFARGNSTCPLTGKVLKSKDLVPNFALKGMVQEWAGKGGLARTISVWCAMRVADYPAGGMHGGKGWPVLPDRIALGQFPLEILWYTRLGWIALRGTKIRLDARGLQGLWKFYDQWRRKFF